MKKLMLIVLLSGCAPEGPSHAEIEAWTACCVKYEACNDDGHGGPNCDDRRMWCLQKSLPLECLADPTGRAGL